MPETSPFAHTATRISDSSGTSPVSASPVIEESMILNDEVLIDVAPDRPGRNIRVRFVHSGRSIPIPADDPWAE